VCMWRSFREMGRAHVWHVMAGGARPPERGKRGVARATGMSLLMPPLLGLLLVNPLGGPAPGRMAMAVGTSGEFVADALLLLLFLSLRRRNNFVMVYMNDDGIQFM